MGAFDMFGSQAYPGFPAGGSIYDYGSQPRSPFADPQAMALLGLSQGLLAAGAPQKFPIGLGGALGQGVGGALSGAMNAQQMNQRQQLVDLEKAKTDMTLQQLAQAQRQFQLQNDLLARFGLTGNAAPAPTAPVDVPPNGLSAGSAAAIGAPWAQSLPTINPSQPPSAVASAPGVPQQFPFSPTQLAAMRIAGFPDLVPAYKAAQPDIKVEGGIGRDMNAGGRIMFTQPVITANGQAVLPNVGADGQFNITSPNGALAVQLAQARASEQARAERDPMLGQLDPQGRPIVQTREQFAQRATAGGIGGTPPVSGPTISQRAGQETLGKGDAERVQSLEQKVPNLVSTLRRLDTLEGLTADEKTFAAAGAEFKTGLGNIVQAFGLKIDKDKTANSETYLAQVAELLKERLASKDYGSGSGVSNLDILTASAPLPTLARTPQGRQQIIQAIRADSNRALTDATSARDYYQEHQSLRGFKYPSETERRPIPKNPSNQSGQTFDALPPAKQFQGKTIRDTTTGKLLKSDGMSWKEVR